MLVIWKTYGWYNFVGIGVIWVGLLGLFGKRKMRESSVPQIIVELFSLLSGDNISLTRLIGGLRDNLYKNLGLMA